MRPGYILPTVGLAHLRQKFEEGILHLRRVVYGKGALIVVMDDAVRGALTILTFYQHAVSRHLKYMGIIG
jgi:hypothetical protein